MNGSIRLVTIAGIDIRMHMTFPLILIWSALQYGVFMLWACKARPSASW